MVYVDLATKKTAVLASTSRLDTNKVCLEAKKQWRKKQLEGMEQRNFPPLFQECPSKIVQFNVHLQ